MKNLFTGGVVVGVMFGAAYAVFAFTEPTALPPLGNTPPPITAGPGKQVKTGDLTVANLKASSITLGEETRTSWFDASSSCGWTEWKCDCRDDSSTLVDVAITMGMRCAGGQLADIKVISLRVVSGTGSSSCPARAPAPCAEALYVRNGVRVVN